MYLHPVNLHFSSILFFSVHSAHLATILSHSYFPPVVGWQQSAHHLIKSLLLSQSISKSAFCSSNLHLISILLWWICNRTTAISVSWLHLISLNLTFILMDQQQCIQFILILLSFLHISNTASWKSYLNLI